MPDISVIMPVYNAERYLCTAVQSILYQTYRDFEFIIVNDSSTDRTADILYKYQRQDDRIIILNNRERLGIARSLNKGIGHAGGEYLARMDGDDISAAARLAVEKKYLDDNPPVGMVGSWFSVIDSAGRVKWRQSPFCEHEDIYRVSIAYNPFVHGSIMLRAAVLDDEIRGYNPSFEPAEDYELWLRTMEKWKVHIIPELLFKYRRHAGSVCSNRRKEQLERAALAKEQAIKRRGLNYEEAFAFSEKWNERCFYYNYNGRIGGEEVIIYGNNWLAERTIKLVEKMSCRVKGFLEDDLNKLGKTLGGYQRYDGAALAGMEDVYIIIASRSWKEKRSRLVREYKIDRERIVYSFYACH